MFIYYLLFILSLSTYFFKYVSVLYTESFILFLAFFVIFIYVSFNASYKVNYSKVEFKWNEVIRFYVVLKNWNRIVIKDRNAKMARLLDLAIQIKKYEIIWVRRNLSIIDSRDTMHLHNLTLQRLDALVQYRKGLKKSLNPINFLTYY